MLRCNDINGLNSRQRTYAIAALIAEKFQAPITLLLLNFPVACIQKVATSANIEQIDGTPYIGFYEVGSF